MQIHLEWQTDKTRGKYIYRTKKVLWKSPDNITAKAQKSKPIRIIADFSTETMKEEHEVTYFKL